MPRLTAKNSKQKDLMWQQYRLSLAVAAHQILGVKHFLSLGTESGRMWWWRMVQYLKKNFLLPMETQNRSEVPDSYCQNSKQKDVIWQQYRLSLAVAEDQTNPWRKTFPYFGNRVRKDVVVEKGTVPEENDYCQWTFLRGKKPKWIFTTSAIFYVHLNWFLPCVSKWFQRSGKSEQFLEPVYLRQL